MEAQPVVLLICDGWGEREEVYGNAIAQAKTPVFDELVRNWPHTVVAASGEAVGLPAGQQGNSEVGHLTIGSGRVIYQALSRISRDIGDGEFAANTALLGAIDGVVAAGATLHCIGLVSPGGVHSHQDHGVALANLAASRGATKIAFHVLADGRDEPPASAREYVAKFVDDLDVKSGARIASVSGRYYAMDRDNRWDRVQRAYEVMTGSGPVTDLSPLAYIDAQYERGLTDEFIEPMRMSGGASVEDGDTVIFWNFRPDRCRELAHAFLDSDFSGFQRSRHPTRLRAVTFTEYEKGLPAAIAFPREDVSDVLAEVISRNGLRQFHVAETEKYAHVTYFVNGGREEPFPLEQRLLIPSPQVATYEVVPAMSAVAVTDRVIDHLAAAADSLIVVNFANADMVGHTGDFAATVAAVECVDACIGRIVAAALEAGAAVVITADHGNAELKIDATDGSPLTAHTTSPVPVILCNGGVAGLQPGGGLSDVAPTILTVMNLPIPAAMTGRSLLA